jgi:mono/diheme cytochrome c family protein
MPLAEGKNMHQRPGRVTSPSPSPNIRRGDRKNLSANVNVRSNRKIIFALWLGEGTEKIPRAQLSERHLCSLPRKDDYNYSASGPTRDSRRMATIPTIFFFQQFARVCAQRVVRSVAIVALALLACPPGSAGAFPWSVDMFRGDAVQPMAESPRVMPANTLPTGGERPRSTAASRKLQNPLAALPKNVEEGGKLYSVYCSVCHGPGGRGDGPVRFILRTPPADLTSHRVVLLKDGSIYGTIRNGTQIMPSYGDALTPAERWRIVLFVRAMQQKSDVANSSPTGSAQ